ncbi:MAG TPA: serine hydrolase [Firmicutes bacterium]|nr:serine hydrolase [Bacillota bacterium]
MRLHKLVILFLLSVILIFSAGAQATDNYLLRVLFWGESDPDDYLRFPSRAIETGPITYEFKKDIRLEVADRLRKARFSSKGDHKEVGDLHEFLVANQTTAFIVIKDDTIIYEEYFNGSNRGSIHTSFSVAKTFASTLIGLAINDGLIKSVEEPIVNYLPELEKADPRFAAITIKHLLNMASGIRYRGRDDTPTYYHPDLRRIALKVKVSERPEQHFLYNNYNPILIGMILERATGMPVAKYLEEKLWKPLGMEYPASWSIDSQKSGLEKMESGINARSIDYAKLGRLFLNQGSWDGRQILPESWVAEATDFSKPKLPSFDKKSWYAHKNVSYNYFWWGFYDHQENWHYSAIGKYGQYIFVSPATNMIIVRNGFGEGQVDFWPELLINMAQQIAEGGSPL